MWAGRLSTSHFPLATEAKILPRRKELDVVCVVYAVAVYADTPLREFHSTRNINFHVAKMCY